MPYYEFSCESCGPFERLLGFGEASEAVPCPGCGGPARRVYSAPGVISKSPARRRIQRINEGDPRVLGRAAKDETPRRKPFRGSPGGSLGGRPWQIGH